MSKDEISKQPCYLFFDIEGYPDIASIAKANNYHGIPNDEILKKYREDQEAKIERLRQRNKWYTENEDWKETTYLPITFQRPLFIAVAKVAADYTFLDTNILSALTDNRFHDDPIQGSYLVCKKFLDGWRHYKRPTLVTLHGTIFDFPFLKFAAFNYGIDVNDFPFDERINKSNSRLKSHIDMYSILSNYGAGRFRDGRRMLTGLLGKTDLFKGIYAKSDELYAERVVKLYKEHKYYVLEKYCLKRILDYYPIFLRLVKLTGGFGSIPSQNFDEENCKASMRHWIQKQIDKEPSQSQTLTDYLEQWNDYFNTANQL
jgi:Predicted 3''-5'' exonuclease related to the exonuclease domain of PolB.